MEGPFRVFYLGVCVHRRGRYCPKCQKRLLEKARGARPPRNVFGRPKGPLPTCPRCGSEYNPKEPKCPYCGAQLPPPPPPPPLPQVLPTKGARP